jgi:hypothetical protein
MGGIGIKLMLYLQTITSRDSPRGNVKQKGDGQDLTTGVREHPRRLLAVRVRWVGEVVCHTQRFLKTRRSLHDCTVC